MDIQHFRALLNHSCFNLAGSTSSPRPVRTSGHITHIYGCRNAFPTIRWIHFELSSFYVFPPLYRWRALRHPYNSFISPRFSISHIAAFPFNPLRDRFPNDREGQQTYGITLCYPLVIIIVSDALPFTINFTWLPNVVSFYMLRKIEHTGKISIVFTIKPRGSEVNASLKSVNRQYRLFFLCLLSSKIAVSLRLAFRQPATPWFISIWKVNDVFVYAPLIVSRIVSYATKVIYFVKILNVGIRKLQNIRIGLFKCLIRIPFRMTLVSSKDPVKC